MYISQLTMTYIYIYIRTLIPRGSVAVLPRNATASIDAEEIRAAFLAGHAAAVFYVAAGEKL